MRQVILAGGLVLGLAACQMPDGRVVSIRGACDAWEAPTQPVIGKRRIDQHWIDKAVETGIRTCGWPRPKAQQIVARAVAGAR